MTPEQVAAKSLEFLQQIEKHLKGGSSAVSRSLSPGALSAREAKALKTETSNFGKQLNLTTSACRSFRNELYKTTAALHKFRLALGGASKDEIKSTIAAERTARKLAESQRKAALAAGGAGKAMGGLGAQAAGANKNVGKLGTKAGGAADEFVDLGVKTTLAGLAFQGVVDLIRGPLWRALTDYMSLTERGIGGSLSELYSNAMKAGMSLQEYVTTLEENRAAVVRAGSFEEFNKRIETTSKQLGELGVFGADARRLSASLQTSATVLGVPQKQLAASTSAQVKVFEDLRKTTMMTSDGFKQLIADFSANENVQEALLGMAPEEREARKRQLLDTYKLGHALGATEDASNRLAQALMSQRKATAKERFEAAGRARQLGAMTGMSAQETEELAKLSQKKNRTAEESARLTELAGQAKARLETLKNSGSLAAEFVAEQLEALLPSQQRELMDAAGVVKLQTDAGKANNKDFAQATSGFAKAVGEFATAITGFTKSPFYDAVKIFGGAVGSFVSIIAGGFFLKKMIGPGAAAADTSIVGNVAKPGAATATPKGPSMLGRAARANSAAGEALIKSTTSIVKSPITMLLKPFQLFGAILGKVAPSVASNMAAFSGSISSFSTTAAKGVSAFTSAVPGLGTGLKALSSVFKTGGPLGFLISGIEEAFTGQMANALGLGDGIFGRLLGIVIGGFNGIFTGITRLFDGAINWLFEGLGIDFKVNTTKLVDYVTSLITDFFKMLGSLFLKGIAWILEKVMGIFGVKEVPFVKSLRKMADDLDASIDESIKNREEMMKTEGATLRSIGEKNIKAQEENAKKSEKLNAKTNNNIAYGIDDLVSKAKTTSKALQAEAAQSKPTTVQATPAQETRSSVTAPEVNKEAKKTGETEKTAEKKATGKPVEAEDTVTISKQQLEVLKQIYEAIVTQNNIAVDTADSLLSELSKNPNKPYQVPHMVSQIMAA